MTMPRLVTIAMLLALVAAPAAAGAEPTSRSRGWFGVGFLGGLLLPMGDMTGTHQQGLAGGLRMGWTGSSGLGLEMAAQYSPLPRRTSGDERFETHFVTAGLLPRFTLGKGRIRLWLGAGGGVAFQHEQQLGADGVQVLDTRMAYAPAGMGAAGLELHVLSGVGLTAVGSYTRALGDLTYELVTVTSGLVLTFR